jgi:hypothetical protein
MQPCCCPPAEALEKKSAAGRAFLCACGTAGGYALHCIGMPALAAAAGTAMPPVIGMAFNVAVTGGTLYAFRTRMNVTTRALVATAAAGGILFSALRGGAHDHGGDTLRPEAQDWYDAQPAAAQKKIQRMAADKGMSLAEDLNSYCSFPKPKTP